MRSPLRCMRPTLFREREQAGVQMVGVPERTPTKAHHEDPPIAGLPDRMAALCVSLRTMARDAPRYVKLIRFTSARKRGSSWRFFHVGSTLRNTIIGSRASNARSSHAMASDRSSRPLHAIAMWYGDT